MSLVFSVNLCPTHVRVFDHALTTCLLKYVCEFPIAIHTYPWIYCDTIDLVGKMRGQGLAQDHGLVPDHGLVLEIKWLSI